MPIEHDFLCVDIDGNDYWILREILAKYLPRVIMVETNVRFKTYEDKVHKYDPNWKWDGYTWYGASPYAIKKMLNARGYTPVWIHLDDMIAVRDDVLKENKYIAPSWSYVYPKPNTALYYNHGIPMGPGAFYCLPWSEVKDGWQESPE